jgi:hypothetical protein
LSKTSNLQVVGCHPSDKEDIELLAALNQALLQLGHSETAVGVKVGFRDLCSNADI